jgi:glutathione S-transferase
MRFDSSSFVMKLFIATPSPFARKARVTLLEKQIPHEIVIDNPWQPASQVKGLNPLAKIPTLVLDDGRVIHDSKVIFEYLELERPGHLPQDKHEKIIHRLVEVVADGICDAVVMTFLENQRPEGSRSQFWLSRQADKIRAGVHELEQKILPSGTFTSLGLGLAEIATVCALGYLDLRYADYNWRSDAPNLLKLFDGLMQRASFLQTVPTVQEVPANR